MLENFRVYVYFARAITAYRGWFSRRFPSWVISCIWWSLQTWPGLITCLRPEYPAARPPTFSRLAYLETVCHINLRVSALGNVRLYCFMRLGFLKGFYQFRFRIIFSCLLMFCWLYASFVNHTFFHYLPQFYLVRYLYVLYLFTVLLVGVQCYISTKIAPIY